VLVSIIVPTLNEEKLIGSTLSAIAALTGKKEIIVADGGSSDQTAEIAVVHGASLVLGPRGRGPQMRAAAAIANGDVLWFLHADTLPPAGALEAIERALGRGAVAGGNFSLVFGGHCHGSRLLTAIYPRLRSLGLCYGDSGVFVRRSVYDSIGGMQPYELFEDLDLVRRIRRAGGFVHLQTSLTTSSRRFEQRNFGAMWLHWMVLQCLFWLGVSPSRLAAWYQTGRR
jgi:rSAM/selenodomain-associated transferase 2